MNTPSREPDSSSRPRTLVGEAGPYLTLGWQIALGFVVFGGVGALVDLWLDTLPWFLLGGVLLGAVAVFAQLYKVSVELGRKDALRRRNRPPASGTSRRAPRKADDVDDWDRRWDEKWSDRWDDDDGWEDEPRPGENAGQGPQTEPPGDRFE